LQQRLIADGAGFMQRQPSHDSHSEASAPSPIYEQPIAQRPPNFANPFPLNQFPPTPPNLSPFPQMSRMVPAPVKSHTFPHATNHQSNLSWQTPVSEFDDSMEFINQFDSPMMDSTIDIASLPPSMFGPDQIVPTAINPCLTMKDWAGQEDLQRYLSPTMV